jgi:hypothetical protein
LGPNVGYGHSSYAIPVADFNLGHWNGCNYLSRLLVRKTLDIIVARIWIVIVMFYRESSRKRALVFKSPKNRRIATDAR